MLRNTEYRSMVIKVIIFQIIFISIVFFSINGELDDLNKKIINRDMGIVGSAYKGNENIISSITKDPSDEDIELGGKILDSYGYKEDMNKNSQRVLDDINRNTIAKISILFILGLFILLAILSFEYKHIYKKVRDVHYAAEKVVEGEFEYVLEEDGEGDFNLLNHQFNQMANRLENTLAILNNEKIFLKNMISDISHQIKTPLSSLIMFNDIMIDDVNMDIATRMKFLEKNNVQLERMEWLIINLLKVARIEAGAIDFKKEKVNLNEVIDSSIENLSVNLKEFNVNIFGSANFIGDRDWTKEAIINIIKNSSEYGRKNIDIALEESPLFSTIRIKDDGMGIDDRDKPYIFERFYKSSNRNKTESIGIGLNLSKLIVESQDGTISVKSKLGEGTEFIITFLKSNI